MPRFVRLGCTPALSLFAAIGCAAPIQQLAYSTNALRAEVIRRAPEAKGSEIPVPFELPRRYLERAHEIVGYRRSDADRARALAHALFDPSGFGLRYSPRATAGAKEALEGAEANCLVVASIFVGLAREIGLSAYYLDASVRHDETRYDGAGITVTVSHVTAMARTEQGDFGLDIERVGPIVGYRILDDLEALAHVYNNRGYDLIEEMANSDGAEAWSRAARSFRLAVEVKPTFAPGWNNLGIATARLGRIDEAMGYYRAAILLDPNLPAPRNNLGSLYLQTGNIVAALENLETAVKLDRSAYHIRYNLARARLLRGDREGAIRALHEAIDLRQDYALAQALLDTLTDHD